MRSATAFLLVTSLVLLALSGAVAQKSAIAVNTYHDVDPLAKPGDVAPGAIESVGDTLYTFIVPGQIILGVARPGNAQKLIFSSGGQDATLTTDNKWIVTDLYGTILDTTHLIQNPTAGQGFGLRDLAWDGRYILGSDNASIRRVDTTAFTDASTFTGPTSPNRGIAAETNNRIWTSNFTSAPVQLRDTLNTLIKSLGVPTVAPYGIAWDPWTTSGKAWLWYAEPSLTGTIRLSKADTSTGAVITSYDYTYLAPGGTTGGLDIINNHPDYPGRVVAIMIIQNFPSSVVAVIDIGPPEVNDMRAAAFVSPLNGAGIQINQAFTPVARFQNAGSATQTSVTVRYQILNGSSTVVYTDDKTIASINADDTTSVTFASVAGGLPAGAYTIRTMSLLGTDTNPGNDTIVGSISAAPSISNYVFIPSGGTFTPVTGGTVPTLTGGSPDDGWFNAIPIGFTFTYNGIPYTQVAATTNGCLFPGATLASSYLSNNLTSGTPRPVIAPLWDDLETPTGNFQYKTEGSPGSQVFTAEWLNILWSYSATGAVISFQVKLYEADGTVEFVYRPEVTAVNFGGASIGITDALTGAGHFLSLNNTSTTPTASFTTETSTLATKPASGQVYAFRLPYANDIASSSFDVPINGGGVPENTAFQPKATFRNTGTADQTTSFNVKYEIINSVPSVVYTNTQSVASLGSGATTQVTFASVAGGLPAGNYTMRTTALLGADQNRLNDTLAGTMTSYLVVQTFPYSEDFEGAAAGWSTAIRTGAANDWMLGTPAKTFITGPHGGTKAWVTKDVGNYSDNHDAYVLAPIMDFSSLSSDPVISFYHNFFAEVNYDGGVLEYSYDGGATWRRVDSTLGTPPDWNTPNSTSWYNNNGTSGPLPPPKWSDTSATKYPSQVSGYVHSTTTLIGAGGLSDVRLRWRFQSDSSVPRDGGWAFDDVTISVSAAITTTVSTGWNMISNPVTTAADSVKQLFPTSLFSYAFAFAGAGGYVQRYELENGVGYWAKFSGGGSVTFTGGTRSLDTIDVVTGWNMIGSISSSVDTSTITSIPIGIRRSNDYWYGYDPSPLGYNAKTTLLPGKGYWVKVYAPGQFVFTEGPAPEKAVASGPGRLESMNTLTITDGLGQSQTLYFGESTEAMEYEMPPVPPQGVFDARFSAMGEETAQGGAILKSHAPGAALPISIQSAVAPLTIGWNIRNGAYMLDAGQGLKAMAGEGALTISGPVSRLILRSAAEGERPMEFALLQNYPNPFNPSTTIRFALPVESRVSVEIFNALGQRVKTLVDGSIVAGFHGVEWNGTGGSGQQLGSGVYFVRFSVTGTDGRTFGDVSKLMLMK